MRCLSTYSQRSGSIREARQEADAALKAALNGTPWQRCQFHLQQNAQEYVTKAHLKTKVASDIRAIFNADDRPHADARLKDFVKTYSESQPKLAAWAEENLPEGFAVFAFPEAHRKRLRTSNACENVNGQIKKRTRVVGLFPSEESSSGWSPACSSKSPRLGKPAKPTSP